MSTTTTCDTCQSEPIWFREKCETCWDAYSLRATKEFKKAFTQARKRKAEETKEYNAEEIVKEFQAMPKPTLTEMMCSRAYQKSLSEYGTAGLVLMGLRDPPVIRRSKRAHALKSK